jgi:isoquinoline 1-oxidoreductase
MNAETLDTTVDIEEPVEFVEFDFVGAGEGVSRRGFVAGLGAGLLVIAFSGRATAQQQPPGRGEGGRGGRGRGGGFRGGGPTNIGARVHISKDGAITVLTGKVEGGQGARAELTQAAAEELRVAPDKVKLVMADTSVVPDDGITAGSRSTPGTLPSIRAGCAAARNLLQAFALRKWGVAPDTVELRDGQALERGGSRRLGYADLASAEESADLFKGTVPQDVAVTPVGDWKVQGKPLARPNGSDIVTGRHHYPSDISRPGMLYGKVLRPASYGAKLTSVDLAPAKAMKGVIAVQDGNLVGVAAPSSHLAGVAIDAVAQSAKWEPAPHPSSEQLSRHLREHARGLPPNPFGDEIRSAAKTLKQTYEVAYVQHTPMEPRAAVAEWQDGKLTVWTATQNPFGVRGELARAFGIPDANIRVVVPDFGGGFGGKHTGECAVEAARLAKAAGKPVSLRWTRQEEFTWAYFRPAAVIDAEAGLDSDNKLTSWYFININSGPSSIETPYRAGKTKTQFVQSEAPLRHGSYRALAATANTFARECFMDELAHAAGADPLAFRQSHLDQGRLRAVLEEAAKRFDWPAQSRRKEPGVGVGIACGTEKGSFVATCAEIVTDAAKGTYSVRRVCTAYECGAIVNPDNLTNQVTGALIMGLGPAMREEMAFDGGKMLNAALARYLVPRFADVPKIDVHLLNRPDLPSVGAGETPLIAVAPAIANAIHHATGTRVRKMPIRLPAPAADAR